MSPVLADCSVAQIVASVACKSKFLAKGRKTEERLISYHTRAAQRCAPTVGRAAGLRRLSLERSNFLFPHCHVPLGASSVDWEYYLLSASAAVLDGGYPLFGRGAIE